MKTFEELTDRDIEYQKEKANAIRQTIARLSDIYSPTTELHNAKCELIQKYRDELEKVYQLLESLH